MSRDVARRIESFLFDILCDRLPHGLEYAGDDDTNDLIVTDGEREYLIEVSVDARLEPVQEAQK